MVTDDQKRAFAARLNEALDDIGFPGKGAGRQSALGTKMRVSQKGARKWLEGESMPATTRGMELAKWLNVNFEWLMTARGEKRNSAPTSEPASQTQPSMEGTSYAAPRVATAVSEILRAIDDQHRLAAISDDDATLLRAALHAVQADISPTIRAAILLMLGAQKSKERAKDPSNRAFNEFPTTSHSPSEAAADSAAAFARNARADLRSAAKPESDDEHDKGKHGT